LSSGLSEKEIEKIFNKVFDEEKHLFGFNDKPKQIKLELTIAERWEFRRNAVLGDCDYRIKSDKNSKFENVNIDTVTRHALTCGQTTTVSNIRSLLQSDFVKEIDPIKEYFNGLDKWDGKTDHIKILSDHVQVAEENRDFFTSMFKKHLVRSVEQTFGGDVNRYVFTLVGEKQKTGKSMFIRKLSPFAKGEYYTESMIRDDKDGQIAFSENFIYNIEEFNSSSIKDANRLKAMISQYVVKERRAYAHGVKVMERRCNLWASTNNSEFLTDTENTRWICFEIMGINWDYSKLDVNLIWSQAMTLYLDPNYSVAFTAEEEQKQSTINKQHEVATTATDVLTQHFRPAKNKDPFAIHLSTTEIMSRMIAIVGVGVRIEKTDVLKALTSLGYICVNSRSGDDKKQRKGFYVVQEDMTPQPFKMLKPNYEQN
jgi:predicted P-loop ATPase